MNWLYNTHEKGPEITLKLSDINIGDMVISLSDKKEGKITRIISSSKIKVSFSNQRWDYAYRNISSLKKK